jgi:dextranase
MSGRINAMSLHLDKATYQPGQSIRITSENSGQLRISRLSECVAMMELDKELLVPSLPEGSYSAELLTPDGIILSTAIEVISNPISRIRYGFVSEYSDEVNAQSYAEFSRRLHLSAVQFYDWAYTHEFLTTDLEEYGDPLGAKISTKKIRELIHEYENSSSLPCAYAAVYAVDREGWKRWSESGLFDSNGNPYQLGEDFLWIIDPGDTNWIEHFIKQLELAHEFGFNAFHLDQYGWPKVALKHDGAVVDLSIRFPQLLNRIASELDKCIHIFNNVNDFPTWSTSQTNQDVLYIEAWDPHSTFKDLADLVDKSHGYGSGKPVIVSAYISAFKDAISPDQLEAARSSLALTMASIVSGGASHLVVGSDGRVLFDPYYVRNHVANEETLNELQKLYDFSVAAGDLLFDPLRVDISRIYSFGINSEVNLESDSPISLDGQPGTLWIRLFKGSTGLTIHCINLLDQKGSKWDEPRQAIRSRTSVTLSIDAIGYKEFAHLGHASHGSSFKRIQLDKNASRLKTKFEIVGAWTIFNIPC